LLAFSGKFLYTVDAKGRVNIPAPFRSQLSEASENTFHIAQGPNDCLFVYPREIFMHTAAKLESKYGSLATPDEERRYFLEMMADAHPARCDQQGRIIVPQDHLAYAKIKNEVLIIGVLNKMELWNPKLFETFIEDSRLSKKERVKRFGGADRE
jgi:MraZ protein